MLSRFRARAGRSRFAAGGVLVALACVSIPAVAASTGASLGPAATLPAGTSSQAAEWPQATAEERSRAPRPSRDDLVRAHAEFEARERQRIDARSSAQGRAGRELSRTAHRGADRARAISILRETFPGVGGRQPRLLDPPRGYHVVGFTSDRVARLEPDGGGPELLVASELPLRRADGSGRRPLVDLSPVDRGLGFEPAHPLIPLRMPRLLAEGIALGRDAHVRIHFEAPGALATTAASIDRNDVFYHEVAPDTDVLVTPQPLGFETFTQLRSPQSPERFSLRFSLPSGAALQLRRDGGASVIREGVEILSVMPPSAADAQGERFPVAYSISGDLLHVDVAHRERDLAYPVVVDPIVDVPGGGRSVLENWVDPSWYTGGWGIDRRGWHAHSYWSGDGTHYWDRYDWPFVYCPTYCSDANYNGLYVKSYWDSYYPSYTQGEWYYPTWGDVYIPRAEFAYLGHYPNQSFMRTSIWSGTLNRYVALKDFHSDPWYSDAERYWTGIASSSDWTHGTSASINLVLPAPAGSSTVFRHEGPVSYLGGSRVYLQDRSAPSQPIVWGHPTNWVHNATGTIFARSTDAGLGVKWFRFRYPTGEQWRTHPCSGDRLGPCPGGGRTSIDSYEGFAWTHADRGFGGDPFSYDTSDWPEGIQTISVEAIDATDRYSPAETRQVFVDHRGPEIRLSGSLWDRREQEVFADDYGLAVTALDGDASSPQTARSGVRRIQIFVDDNLEGETSAQSCPAGSCSMSTTYVFVPTRAEYEPGVHEIKVVAYDQVGNASTARFTVSIADQDPLLTEAEFLEQNLAFRREFGYEADLARVKSIMHTSAYNDARAAYSVPLTPSEAREFDARAAALEEEAIDEYGEGEASLEYAGYEMDHAQGGLIEVRFTGNHALHLERLRTRVSQPERLRVLPATRTLTQLEAVRQQVDADTTTLQLQGLTLVATSIDVAGNQVIAAVASEPTAMQRTYIESRYGDAVELVVGTFEALRGRGPSRRTSFFPTQMGGMRIVRGDGAACTSGFTFEGGSPEGPGVTTAGHCARQRGETWNQGGRFLGQTNNWAFGGYYYPGPLIGTTSDGATIVSGGERPATNKVYISRRNLRTINRRESDRRPRRGAPECISGATSGYDCGRLAKTVHYNRMVFRLVRSMTCAPGDSGAPIFYSTTAHGSLSGQYREEYNDGKIRTYCAFSHITRLERDLGFLTKTSP